MGGTISCKYRAPPLSVCTKCDKWIPFDCSCHKSFRPGNRLIVAKHLRPFRPNPFQRFVLPYGNRTHAFAVLHPVIYRQHFHRKDLLDGGVVPFSFGIHTGEGKIPPYHQQGSAFHDIVSDNLCPVRPLLALRERSRRKQKSICSDIGKDHAVIRIQLLHCKWKLLRSYMVRKEIHFISAFFKCRNQPLLPRFIYGCIKTVKSFHMGRVAHP